MREQLLALKNKDFIYQSLSILIANNRKFYIEKLTECDFCKKRFDMNLAILQEVSPSGSISEKDFSDNSGHRRYYPKPICAFGKRYIVCNDWYYKSTSTTRDTRTNFVDWILI